MLDTSTGFPAHTKALGSAVLWQHMRTRALFISYVRLMAPLALIALFYYYKDGVKDSIVTSMAEDQETQLKTYIANMSNGGRQPHSKAAMNKDLHKTDMPDDDFASLLAAADMVPGEASDRMLAAEHKDSVSESNWTSVTPNLQKVARVRSSRISNGFSLDVDSAGDARPDFAMRSISTASLLETQGMPSFPAAGLQVAGQETTTLPPKAATDGAVITPPKDGGPVTAKDVKLSPQAVELIKVNIAGGLTEYYAEAVDGFYGIMMFITAILSLTFFLGKLGAERDSGLRHLMHISGLSRYAFWLVQFSLEGVAQTMLEMLIVSSVMMLALQPRALLYSSWLIIALILFLIAASIVAVGCVVHLALRSQRLSNICGMCLSLVFLLAAPVYWAMQEKESLHMMSWKVLACPILTSTSNLYLLAKACSKGSDHCVGHSNLTTETWIAPWEIVMGSEKWKDTSALGQIMGMSGVVVAQLICYIIVVLVADVWQFPSLSRNHADSRNEGDDALTVENLEHEYFWLPCVSATGVKTLKGVTFTIAPGAMLGLLGPNGAGKTTSIRCITGEEAPLGGKVIVRPRRREYIPVTNSEIESDEEGGRPRLRRMSRRGNTEVEENGTTQAYIGLCPQETALADDLTVEEHLTFFAGLRESLNPQRCAQDLLRITRLESKRREVPAHLSGGMRRRLSIGCSMVGDPDLALLDEPTTGLDPATRRDIWEAIMDARDMGTACLLTTHMLEEAEYLSTNIVVMSLGVVSAEGSVQQLKEKYSEGYMLTVDSNSGQEKRVKSYVSSLLPTEHREPLKSSLHGNMCFNVSKDAVFVGNLFLELAKNASANEVRTWGISQANLEDAYLKIIGHSR